MSFNCKFAYCSSSGGFYTLKEHQHQHQHQHYRHGHGHGTVSTSQRLFASSAPSGTVMMYPNAQRAPVLANPTAAGGAGGVGGLAGGANVAQAAAATPPDISLRQRAVAKLRMFNFHLNWDLHMTHCKPCG